MTPVRRPKKGSNATPDAFELERYRDKRDPASTNEPFETERGFSSERQTWAGRFVVHQHAATRMHFDLRIEMGGALQSFAVPKGPSLNPAEKRLAMHTEAHPVAYLDFEDVIPEGNYGAGPMIVWDTGGIVYMETSGEEGLQQGKIDFVLQGFKLRGRFALIATGKKKRERVALIPGTYTDAAENEWLLVKKPDSSARTDYDIVTSKPESVLSGLRVDELPHRELLSQRLKEECLTRGGSVWNHPGALVPMVCALEGAPQKSAEWLYELKLDGVRIVAEKNRDMVQLSYRSGRSATSSYPEVARALRALLPERVVLDGEVVTFDERGHPHFARLLPRVMAKRARDVARVQREVPVIFLVFDVIAFEDIDLRALPLVARKQILLKFVKGDGYIRSLDHISEHGDALFSFCEREGLEGMVAKRATSPYELGPKVSGNWVKIKRNQNADFIVVGFAPPSGTKNGVGALALGSHLRSKLVYRGRVGSGLDTQTRTELARLLSPLIEERSPWESPPTNNKDITWVQPKLVASVRFQGITDDGHLRAPVFEGLRADRNPEDCVFTTPDEMRDWALEQNDDRQSTSAGSYAEKHAIRASFSNIDKVFFPEDGVTKGDLLDYAVHVAPYLLPFLAGRPVVLVRYPDGIHGKNFYQWRAPEGTPDWMRTIELYDEDKQIERGTGKAAFLIDDLDALLHVVNLGCIPLHVLASRETTPTHCDFFTIDFDIAERPFSDAVRLALALREILSTLGLESFPKTSGQRGLHVLVPLGPGVPFAAAKLLCELIGRVLVGRHPDIATMERRKEQRGEKVYIDTGQTGRSRTIVAPYSVRAIEGARVSTPLRWNEIHLALSPASFNIETVVQRLTQVQDPLVGFFDCHPDLQRTMRELERWTKAM